MIETISDFEKFQSENRDGDLILHVVPVESDSHPSDTFPSILFIRNISTGRSYYYAIDHPDSLPKISLKDLMDYLTLCGNIKWALDRKVMTQLLYIKNVYDANLCGFLEKNDIIDPSEFETPAHNLVRRNAHSHTRVNRAIPLLKHLEAFDDMCEDVIKMIKNFNVYPAFLQVNNKIISTLRNLEFNGIYVDNELFKTYFKTIPNKDGMVFSQYNVYTSTGRPSNRFGGVNYAALNHSDGSRKCFVSRYGNDGKMVMVDYTAFHPRIICLLTDYKIPIETDIYEYLAKLYFQKKEVDETDISNAKQLTFRQLYGGVEDKYSHIKYLANLKSFIDEKWDFFQKNGYVETPLFKRKITEHHIQGPNPTKLFNYILQASEGEIAIPRIQLVQDYLLNKKAKTKPIIYTYDSVLYDFHKDDGIETLNEIREIMSCNKAFPMKTYIGGSYQDLRLISL